MLRFAILLLSCFAVFSCTENPRFLEKEIDYSKVLADSIKLNLLVDRYLAYPKEFYLGKDSCKTVQSYEYKGEKGQMLRVEFFPTDSLQTEDIRHIINNWLVDSLLLHACQTKYCAYYSKSTNNIDLEISFFDETELRDLPYLALEFYEKEGIAE